MDQTKIGEFLKELRKEKNMTFSELSQKSGISKATLTNWNKGKTHPQPVMLKKIADALGCDFDELLFL